MSLPEVVVEEEHSTTPFWSFSCYFGCYYDVDDSKRIESFVEATVTNRSDDVSEIWSDGGRVSFLIGPRPI